MQLCILRSKPAAKDGTTHVFSHVCLPDSIRLTSVTSDDSLHDGCWKGFEMAIFMVKMGIDEIFGDHIFRPKKRFTTSQVTGDYQTRKSKINLSDNTSDHILCYPIVVLILLEPRSIGNSTWFLFHHVPIVTQKILPSSNDPNQIRPIIFPFNKLNR